MKAIVLSGPEAYAMQEIDKPVCPENGLLLKVSYCGLCGSDLRTLRSGHKNVKYPAVIGHEVSGIIAEVGRKYEGPLCVGDRLAVAPNVYCGECRFCKAGRYEYCENLRELAQHWPGGFAEYMAIPYEALRNGTIQPLSPNAKLEYACIAEPPSSCINAQEKLQISLGDHVLVIGAGPIGCIHANVAKIRGAASVIMADISDERLALTADFGADTCINSAKEDLVQAIMDLTEGKGVDVVITANPVPITQAQAIQVAAKAGRIAFFGGLPHDKSENVLNSNMIHYKGLHIIGTTGFAPRHHIMALELINSGRIPGEKLVTHILPLEQFAQGVSLASRGEAMKVVFKI